MKTLGTIIGVVTLIMSGLLGWFICDYNHALETPVGSVERGSEYSYQQLTGAIATTSLINAYSLGSVVITEDQAGAMVLYDATSTAAVSGGASSLYTRIADFPSASTEGVYTFDVLLSKGLVWVSDDGFLFAGDWTITYR